VSGGDPLPGRPAAGAGVNPHISRMSAQMQPSGLRWHSIKSAPCGPLLALFVPFSPALSVAEYGKWELL
jgi:hypothetical protein